MFVPMLTGIDNPETVVEIEYHDSYIPSRRERQYRFYNKGDLIFGQSRWRSTTGNLDKRVVKEPSTISKGSLERVFATYFLGESSPLVS